MEWIYGIQNAINYIEEHLTENIDYSIVAEKAYSSNFHFQRVFSIICGFTIGDYIRMRRLSIAAGDLIYTNEKVIDIALKYGYDTHESFTRAFSKFHGVTPTDARKGAKVKSFSKLSIKLILIGGSTMDYRIEKKDSFKILCKRRKVTKEENKTATHDIQAYWEECTKDGTIQRICGYFPEEPNLKGLLGICFSEEVKDSQFPYAIGVEYDGREITDKDFEVCDISAKTFAVFTSKGKMPDTFKETYKKIITEFFPQNERYEYANGIELEVYPDDNIDNPNYTCEIWVEVKEK